MANKKHLEVLRNGGVEAWNKWRVDNAEINPDLSYADLSDMDLSGINLCGANIVGTKFSNSNLSNANLRASGLRIGTDSQMTVLIKNLAVVAVYFLATPVLGVLSAVPGIFIAMNYRDLSAGALTDQGYLVFAIFSATYWLILRASSSVETLSVVFVLLVTSISALGYPVSTIWNCASISIVISVMVSAYKKTKPLDNSVLWFGGILGIVTASIFFVQEQGMFYVGMSEASAVLQVNMVLEWLAYSFIFLVLNILVAQKIYSSAKVSGLLKEFALSFVSQGGTSFRYADLSGADLSEAVLIDADLRGANIDCTLFQSTKGLDRALLSGTILLDEDVRSLLTEEDYLDRSFRGKDLRGANLSNRDLQGIDLNETDLIGACVENSDLSNSNLARVRAFRASFKGSVLTGACVENIGVDTQTDLDGIVCSHIYLEEGEKERRPIEETAYFEERDFTNMFQKALNTVDLIFSDGINWQAFLQSFQEVREQYAAANPNLQAIETKKDNAVVVRIELSSDFDRATILGHFKELYEEKLALVEQQYKAKFQAQEREIEIYRQQSSDRMEIIERLARPMTSNVNQNFNAPVGNVAATNQGKMQNIQHIYAPEQEDLSEAAKEIQMLLNTLSETYNTTTNAGKSELMKELGQEVEKHPKWRRALKEGGIELIKVLCAPIGVPLEMARVYLEDNE